MIYDFYIWCKIIGDPLTKCVDQNIAKFKIVFYSVRAVIFLRPTSGKHVNTSLMMG